MKDFQDYIEGRSKHFEDIKLNEYFTNLSFKKYGLEFNAHSDVDDSLMLQANPSDISSLFENLIKNAQEAGAQKIDITARVVGADELEKFITKRGGASFEHLLDIKGKGSSAKKEQSIKIVEIRVRDDGPGITTKHRREIFEQGFSTKEGENRGLGLASVLNIVKEYSGEIYYYTEEPARQGACFILLLPVLSISPKS